MHEPVLEVLVYWQQIPGQLADRFTARVVVDKTAGSLVRTLAVLYAERAVLAELERQNLLEAPELTTVRPKGAES